MFRTPPGSPIPRLPSPEERLAGFGRRFAMVAAPGPGWLLLVGSSAQDDFVCGLDVTYVVDRRAVALVRTSRPVPEHFRVRSETTLAGTLAEFVANSGDGWPWTGPSPIDALRATPTPLLVDGSEVEGSGILYEDFFGAAVSLGDEMFTVVGRSDVAETARSLALGTELRGEVWTPGPRAT